MAEHAGYLAVGKEQCPKENPTEPAGL